MFHGILVVSMAPWGYQEVSMLMDVGFKVSKGGRGQKAVLSHETIIS